MQSALSRLCSLCNDIDFSALVWPTLHMKQVTTAKIDLGEAQDVRARASECDFCHLIISRLDRVEDPDIEKNAHDRCWLGTKLFDSAQVVTERPGNGEMFEVCWLYIEIAPTTFKGFVGPIVPDIIYKPGVQNPTSSDATIQSRPWTLMHLQGCIDPIPHVDTYCQGDGLLAAPLWESRYSGRLRDPVLHHDLPRRWLQLCMEHHKKDCSSVPHPIVDDFRVIDVREMAIVRAQRACQYVALSYCWGSSSTVLLKRDNIESFAVARSLSNITLPNTITDAVTVTRGLGIRYLWVDALCIVQDDTALLLKQIPQMAHIYEQSVCTIIAAAAENADGGLAGVRSGTRTINSITIRLPGMNLVTAAEDPELPGNNSLERRMDLMDYRWRSRAWTLQEEVVSRRKIFFEGDRIFWCCSHGILTEETVKEVATARRSIRNNRSDTVSSSFLEINTMSESIMDKDFTPALYERIVMYYSERNLSFPSDSINAISGILLQFSQKHRFKFTWGHPEAWFASSLLWTTNYQCSPNGGVQKVTWGDSTEAEIPIPTWSWAAWVGKLDGDRVFYKFALRPYRSTRGYWCPLFYRCTIDARNKPLPYACLNPESLQGLNGNQSHPSWVGRPQHIDLSTSGPTQNALDSGLLRFWTSVATVYVGKRSTLLRRETVDHVLLNQNAIPLDNGCFIQSLETLSWADETRYEHYPTAVANLREDFVQGVHKIHALAIELHDRFVSILIVEKVGNTYYRRGICSTQENRWLKSDPKWSLITLG
ncbi:HET-domain-containing protein [Didymella exigua CBS 183.55]|uniref:HET-domain-containing protein n=1 Tax=Didymella exigua CBS 183.55 TaxID=1150837 RepID=A0A6A5RMT3_9PLEO|nr:HET-domain-containing protein [Didymella exigua CBS 183.55]KAF1928448.1 HET-domain-containing protein [Didymella exigua CBS 183.55]